VSAPGGRDRLLLLKLWLRAPLTIATWGPSSPAMARAFARHVDPDAADPVLELGAGTGPVTRAILDRGLPPERLILVEKMPELCALLRRRFPGATVIEGDAAGLGPALAALGIERLSLVISTLPIVWFPATAQRAIVDACFARMGRDGRFLQMTNQIASPLPRRRLGLAGAAFATVWRDVLPTSAWAYRLA
jgi:phosphatidylethanolamine/phosphatidyl-N-methylethanolamine N-methyltransferase